MARKQKPKSKSPRTRRPEREAKKSAADIAPPPASGPGLRGPAVWWHPLAVILGLSLLLYANTLGHDYALDDAIVITENDYTMEGFSGIGKIFNSDAFEGYFGEKKDLVAGGRYRPLSIATFAVEIGVFGQSPGVSHFFNLLLYGFTGIVLYLVLLELFPPKDKERWFASIAFLATVIFIAHPIHTEAVANIKGRDEIMALLFSLSTLYAMLRYVDTKQISFLIWGAAFYMLALFSKETALPFMAIIPLTLWFFRKDLKMNDWLATAAMGMGLPLLLYFGIRIAVVGFPNATETNEILNDPFIHATLSERLATISHTLGIYLQLLFFPVILVHDYYFNQVPIIGWDSIHALIPLAVYLGLLAYAIRGTLKRDPVAYAIWFYFLSLSIVSNIVLPIGTTMGERFVFVPSVGFALALVLLLKAASVRFRRPQAMWYAAAAIALIFAVRTVIRNPVWKDNFTLFTTDVAFSPNSAKLQTAAGGALVDEVDKINDPGKQREYLQRAILHLNLAVKIYPQHGMAWLLLGNAYYKLDDNYADAMRCFEQALIYRPGMPQAINNAAVTSGKLNRHPEAAHYFRRLIKMDPNRADYWYDLAINYENWNKPDSALYAYENTLKLNPQHADAMGKTAMVYGKFLNDLPKAIEFGKKALEISQDKEYIYENLGIAHAMSGNPQEALKVFNAGMQRFPNSAKLHQNIGVTYINLGDTVKANTYFQRAQQLGGAGG